MIATALAIQDATKQAVHDSEVMDMAAAIYHSRHEVNEDEFIRMMYIYSAHLSAMTATLVTHACLTESQVNDMIETIKEMETMGKDIE
jgi:hypothetical protein